jgi:hypothetical protein
MLAEPRFEDCLVHEVGFIETDEPVVCVQVAEVQFVAVQQQEDTRGSNCCAFVAVHKGMILGQTLDSGSLRQAPEEFRMFANKGVEGGAKRNRGLRFFLKKTNEFLDSGALLGRKSVD